MSLRRIELKPGETPEGQAPDRPRLLVLRSAPPEAVVARGGLAVRLLLAGEETFELAGRTWTARAGDLIALWPGPPIRRRSKGVSRAVVLEIPAPLSGLPDAPPALVVPAAGQTLGRWLGARVEALFSGEGSAAASEALGRAREDLPALEAALLSRLGKIGAGKLATRLDLLRRVETARCRLDAAPRPLSLEALGSSVGLSPHHLARTFKDVFGVSPIAYQRGRLLDRADEALRAGASLAAAAAGAGYAETASFSRAFSRRHGISPGEAAKTKTPGGEAGRFR